MYIAYTPNTRRKKVTTICALLNKTYQNLLKSDAMLNTGHHAPISNCGITEQKASHIVYSLKYTSPKNCLNNALKLEKLKSALVY